jgi:UDP-sugar transporter A1/2/3
MYAMDRPPAIHLNIIGPNDQHDDGDDEELGLVSDAVTASAVPSLWGIPLKYLSYVLLG